MHQFLIPSDNIFKVKECKFSNFLWMLQNAKFTAMLNFCYLVLFAKETGNDMVFKSGIKN